MSFDSIHFTQSNTDDRLQEREQDEPRLSFINPLQKTSSLSSAPSDSDWISPFTLPALPTFRRPQGDPAAVHSPDHLRDRSSSSAYYASAWGSPYATPSPQRSPPLNRQRQPEPTTDFSSPLNPKHWPYYSIPYSIEGEETTTGKGVEGRATPLEGLATIHSGQSERTNWLSESEDSEGEDAKRKRRDTLTPKALSRSRHEKAVRKRQSYESVETVTLETFNVPPSLLGTAQFPAMAASDVANLMGREQDAIPQDATLPEKPLPRVPSSEVVHEVAEKQPADSNPLLSRPRLPSMQSSFSRPKKKVFWKGKQCIIALPLTDRTNANLPPLLSPAEFQQRLDDFVRAGYDIKGFGLSDTTDRATPIRNGQSRSLFPDPVDIINERRQGDFHVHIPDQAEWNSWVEYLKEEKLRALGVTPSNSEPPASSRSPFSQTLSRTSSSYMNIGVSPLMAPSSAVGIAAMRVSSNPFSPLIGGSATGSSHPGSIASPGSTTMSSAPHAYQPSATQPLIGGRMTSPFDYPISQPTAPSGRSPPGAQRQTAFSPNGVAIQSLDEVLSPPVGPSTAARRPAQTVHDTVPGASHLPAPQSLGSPFPPSQSVGVQSPLNLTHTPAYDETSRTPLELAHPTPRSHRHNLSAALQKEIDAAEAALEREDSRHGSRKFQSSLPVNSAFSENGYDEPPILRRPETLRETDEKSEIETNPSMAASPMLLDDINPFATWQAWRDSSKLQPDLRPSHTAQQSVSKFNVEAKEFNPSGVFSSATFGFNGPSFQHSLPVQQPPAGSQRPPRVPKRTSISGLNIDAPAFTPGSNFSMQKPPGSFEFSSATFNVEAPVFNPQSSVKDIGSDHPDSSPDVDSAKKDTIFGNVVIDTSMKASRRSTKAPPNSKMRTELFSEDGSDSEETDGRPSAPIERQKRARRKGSDGDQSPVYHEAPPFAHTRILSEILDDANMREQSSDMAHDIENDTINEATQSRPAADDANSALPAKGSTNGSHAAFEFKNERDAIDFSQARPSSSIDNSGLPQDYSPIREMSQSAPAHPNEFQRDLLNRFHGVSDTEDQATNSSSVLAGPFEPLHPISTSPPGSAGMQPTEPKPRKSFGLEASRFATKIRTPSPSPSDVRSLSTPPEDLYSYIKPEDAGSDDEELSEVKNDDNSLTDHEASQTSVVEPRADRTVQDQTDSVNVDSASATSHFDEPMPSYEEIDAVMKQFEKDPELGIERNDTPVQSTPLIDMCLPSTQGDMPLRTAQTKPSYHAVRCPELDDPLHLHHGLGIGVHKLNDGREATSDWNNTLSPGQEDKLEARAQFFDGHVNDLVDGLLENRLGPLERTLETMKDSLALLATDRTRTGRPRTTSTDNKDSDADDEDEYDAFEGYAQYRARSPSRGDKKSDRLKAVITQALSEHLHATQLQSQVDLEDIKSSLSDFKDTSRQLLSQVPHDGVKAILEDVISTHPRLRGQRVQHEHESNDEKFKLQLSGLESMLQAANERMQEEAIARRGAEDKVDRLRHQLKVAEEQVAHHHESSEATQQTLLDLMKQKEASKDLVVAIDNLQAQNDALQATLQEYRLSHDQWRNDLDTERTRTRELARTQQDLRQQLDNRSDSREQLRGQIERLREKMSALVEDVTTEQIEWRKQELEHRHELKNAQDNLQRETVIREKLDAEFTALAKEHAELHGRELAHQQDAKANQDELRREIVLRQQLEAELATLTKEHKDNLHLRPAHDQAQEEISRLHLVSCRLEDQVRIHKDTNLRLERELTEAKENLDTSIATATARLHSEVDTIRDQMSGIEADRDAQIARLRSRLDNAELDLEEQKAKHESITMETAEAHAQAMQETKAKHETAIEEQHAAQDKKLNDLRERHTRALHNSSDDRHRLENHLNERLALSEDKVKHLESKVADLEDRLEITKSAARAAVEAASKKGVDLPTPAPSVVASPPQRVASASMPVLKGTDIPEKISPQALRESIMVLQDQLQQREHRIEQLQAQVAGVDQEAQTKLKEREAEVVWLRELFGVRIDDLEEVIKTLTEANFDREAARDAAIRLKANLQMEQQIRERAGSSPGFINALPSLAILTQSPRALPMAAAAAWGNWLKARDTSLGALSDLATNLGSQTPSKSATSPTSFLSGMMTPPTTSQKTPVLGDSTNGTTPRPLAAAAAARKGSSSAARPLRAYSSTPRTLASRKSPSPPTGRSTMAVLPSTPMINTTLSEVHGSDLTDDFDEDASPLENKFSYKRNEDEFDLTVR